MTGMWCLLLIRQGRQGGAIRACLYCHVYPISDVNLLWSSSRAKSGGHPAKTAPSCGLVYTFVCRERNTHPTFLARSPRFELLRAHTVADRDSMVVPALAAVPSRGARDARDGIRKSGSPTLQKRRVAISEKVRGWLGSIAAACCAPTTNVWSSTLFTFSFKCHRRLS